MMAIPCSARARMISWMLLLEAMSMPMVGPSRMKTFGSVASHLASTTRCWLPPERLQARTRAEGALMFSSSSQRFSVLRRRAGSSRPRAPSSFFSTVITMLSPMDWPMNSPWVRRSSGR